MKFSSAAAVVPIWTIFVVGGGAVVSPTHAQPANLIFTTVVADADPFAACGDYADWIGAGLASAMYPTSSTSTNEEPERRFLRGVMWPGRVPDREVDLPPRNSNNSSNNNNNKPICLRSDCADAEDLQDDTASPPDWCHGFCKAFYPGTCERTFPQCVHQHNHHNKTKNLPHRRQLEQDTVAVVGDEDSLSDWCGSNCLGFQPGTCQRAFPWCDGMAHPLEQQQPQQAKDSNVVVDTPPALGGVLPFPPLEPQDPDSLDCVTLQRAVQDKLAELASTIVKDNEACATALLEQYEIQCFRVVADQRP